MTTRLVLTVAVVMLVHAGFPAAQAPESWQLVLVDRAGATKPLGKLPPTAFAPRVSPDGRQIVFDAQGAIWIADLNDIETPRRLASGAFPLWSGDGSRVLFIVGQGETQQLFWQAADGSGKPELLIADARAPESWSASAQVLTYITLKGANYDVQAYSLRDRTSTPLAAKPEAIEMGSRFAPDGRWIAYESSETGTREIYVEPFPQTGARTKITSGGGRRPLWSPDGREIFFDRDDAQLYAVPITLGSTVTVGAPVTLPIKGFLQGAARRMYDVTPDGKSFLLLFR
jgi:eukaryotic-like serine/threonine-protein kinase